MSELYEHDFVAWLNHQAFLLKSNKLTEIDIENIAEELETLGRNEHRELGSRLEVLLCHLLKWYVQPERQSNSWNNTIIEQRDCIEAIIEYSPSLKRDLQSDEWYQKRWLKAVAKAMKETHLPKSKFPLDPIWSASQVLDFDFYPQAEIQIKDKNCER